MLLYHHYKRKNLCKPSTQNIIAYLVVEWNRPYIKDYLKNKKDNYLNWPDQLIEAIHISDERAQQIIGNYYSPGSYMISEWKRNLGIEIACYNEDNASLPYPIKIVRNPYHCNYSALPPSKSDEGQGL